MKTVLVILVVSGVVFGAKFPADWKLCRGSNDLNNCLKEAIQDVLPKLTNGVTDLKVPPLEPLTIPSVTIGEGTGPVNVVQNFENFQLYGIPATKITKVEAIDDGNEIDTEATIPEIKLLADYNFNGRILLLPIVGKGKCQITLTDLKVKIKMLSKLVEKKGVSYRKVESHKVELNPGKMTFNFENLFEGDARLGNEINKLLNENWKDVFNDVKSGYETVFGTIFTDYANKIYSKVPYDQF